ncbi:unnamed protein product [Rhizoctonia solani]|uniref:Uncharacterized protein n=1 Tax=Rhizoctonia solani TaxID=456999 RepID=A0A8H3E130_9AGAM|nr:unnamed protein product [Rhizoctonia solani]
MEPSQWTKTISVNLFGTFLVTRQFLRNLRDPRKGYEPDLSKVAMVVMGSTCAEFGEQGHIDYACGSSGLQFGLVRTLKHEIVKIAPAGRVNAVCPGWVNTPMAGLFMEDPDVVNKIINDTPLKRIAQPIDVANQVLGGFLIKEPPDWPPVGKEAISMALGRPVQESPHVPTFAPNTEPVPVIPSKRRLRTGATRATRPIKRRRLVSPEDQDVPQSDQVGTEVLTVADISPNYSHPKLANSAPSPSPTPPPVSPSLTASATSTSGFFIAPTEPDLWQEKNQFEVDYNDVPGEEPRDVTVSCQSISGDIHPKSDLHITQESHFFAAAIPTLNTVPVEPTALSPPKCLVPAKRCAPDKFQPNLFQTKRRRITPTEIREFHTPLPTSVVADLPPLSLSRNEPKTTQSFTIPTSNDPSPPSEPSFRPSTNQNPPIQPPSTEDP